MSSDSGKLGGKTPWAGRRRPATRRAGYNATSEVRLATDEIVGYALDEGRVLTIEFDVPAIGDGEWGGFGGWFRATRGINVDLAWPSQRVVLTEYSHPSWNKVGTLYQGEQGPAKATLRFSAAKSGVVALYDMLAGEVHHDYITDARPELLRNMWIIAPEANFYDPLNPGGVSIFYEHARGNHELTADGAETIILKSCNRCGRYLPVNLPDERERDTLSFSNHCVSKIRRPCRHASFGRITTRDGGEQVQLEYGFQLECRFCKKFEVNAAHNPQRTAGQMKEDAARRRGFELLLEYLYGGSDQLRYRRETGRELSTDVFDRFAGRCFKCGTPLASEKDMHLDHTRPLALLWPLDGTATALCATHNSEKRDRPPVDFYTEDELVVLAEITGIHLDDLYSPSPNVEAVDLLGQDLDWFYDVFLKLPQLQVVRDGKRAADLVVKALNKVLARYPGGAPFHLR